jgi:hypothetical protein
MPFAYTPEETSSLLLAGALPALDNVSLATKGRFLHPEPPRNVRGAHQVRLLAAEKPASPVKGQEGARSRNGGQHTMIRSPVQD